MRDPCKDPKAGDVLKTNHMTILLMFVDGSEVMYASTATMGTHFKPLNKFRRVFKTAKVLHAAD